MDPSFELLDNMYAFIYLIDVIVTLLAIC